MVRPMDVDFAVVRMFSDSWQALQINLIVIARDGIPFFGPKNVKSGLWA